MYNEAIVLLSVPVLLIAPILAKNYLFPALIRYDQLSRARAHAEKIPLQTSEYFQDI